MIIFNGVGLETVAPVKIEDILVSPVELSVTARDRPVRAGADFVRIKSGTRTVTISSRTEASATQNSAPAAAASA